VILLGVLIFNYIPVSATITTDSIHIDDTVINKLKTEKEISVSVVLKDASYINYARALSTEENYEVYLEKAE